MTSNLKLPCPCNRLDLRLLGEDETGQASSEETLQVPQTNTLSAMER